MPAEIRAGVLIEALPYFREFYGKTLVVKYGGNAMVDDRLKEQVMQDIALMRYVGIRPILVHGGGPEISALMKQMGHEPTFIGGLRVTDAATMEIVEMALTGKTNKKAIEIQQLYEGNSVTGEVSAYRGEAILITAIRGRDPRRTSPAARTCVALVSTPVVTT